MSLINDALKKAQRQRAAVAVLPHPAPAQPVIVKRRPPLPAKWIALLAASAASTALVAAVVALYLLRDSTPPSAISVPPKSPPPAATAPPPAQPALDTPAPLVRLPDASAAPASATPDRVPPLAPASDTVAITPPPTAPAAPLATAQPEPAPAAAAPTPAVSFQVPQPDELAIAFVEKLRVAGIRSSGADSKVLMNDRVYRVNDVVERTLGLRLVQVTPDTLTFEDAHGLIYTKNF